MINGALKTQKIRWGRHCSPHRDRLKWKSVAGGWQCDGVTFFPASYFLPWPKERPRACKSRLHLRGTLRKQQRLRKKENAISLPRKLHWSSRQRCIKSVSKLFFSITTTQFYCYNRILQRKSTNRSVGLPCSTVLFPTLTFFFHRTTDGIGCLWRKAHDHEKWCSGGVSGSCADDSLCLIIWL